jgi:DNA (cytosine-5)-methyltransferase 1
MISRLSLLAGIGIFTAAALAAPPAPIVLARTPDPATLIKGLIVDSFAGGGGASLGIEWALGRSPDIAINHDAEALIMHEANHPDTVHMTENVWKVDPRAATGGKPVALLWASPDCRHHSKAKGGAPVSRSVRGLADVVLVWADTVEPQVICMENVEEWAQWGPLGEDGRPCPHRKGWEFARWVRALEAKGYQVDFREIRCCNYGSPTIRKRLFLVARCDGKPILWPEETHAAPTDQRVAADERSAWLTAASDVIDWSIPCHSIFLTKAEAKARGVNVVRPLAPKTLSRVARGMKRYVLDREEPFIVTVNHGGDEFRGQAVGEPFRTVTRARDGHGLVSPFIAAVSHGEMGPNSKRWGKGARGGDEPLGTVTRSNDHAVVSPFVAYAQQGGAVRDPLAPLHTVTASVKDQNQVVVPYLVPRYGERAGQEPRTRDVAEPAPTIVPTGNGGDLAAVFLAQHNDNRIGSDPAQPAPTVTTRGTQTHVVAAYLAREFGKSVGSDPEAPVGTITAGGGGKTRVIAAWMAQHNLGMIGHEIDAPVSTILQQGSNQMPVMAYLSPLQSQSSGADARAPLGTVLADGNHHAVVELPFVQAYYGEGPQGHAADEPLWTVPTKARFGPTKAIASIPPFTEEMEARARQVAEFLRAEGVWTGGEFVTVGPYVVVDIAMRMLTARELARAQGFPDYYDITAGGRLTDTAQRHKIGNSVCPHVAYHLVRANLVDAMAMPDVKRRTKVKVVVGPGLPAGPQATLFDQIAAGPA